MKTKYAIRSLHRHDDLVPDLFCAIHGWTPFYTRDHAKARKFETAKEARAYALKELFCEEAGVFEIITLA
jgi:hypothetical protein